MELYTLNTTYQRMEVIDQFESLIWSERFNEIGDFQLNIASTPAIRNLIVPKLMFAMNDSVRTMIVETVVDNDADDGRTLLVKGKSMESILEHRTAWPAFFGYQTLPKWRITNTPIAAAEHIFQSIVLEGDLALQDIIDNIANGGILPSDTIPAPTVSQLFEIEFPSSVFDAMKQICQLFDLGIRLYRDPFNQGALYYDVYTGRDMTASGGAESPVVFAPELDNLKNIAEIKDISTHNNIAFVAYPLGATWVTMDGVDPDLIAGFDRRVLTYKFDDQTDSEADTPEEIAAERERQRLAAIQKGKEELAKQQVLHAFDGEINQFSQYKYGTDYHVGDVIELRNSDGFRNFMRVTEQTFVSDKEGERSYPTLSLRQIATPGSWATFDPSIDWDEMGATDYWDTME